MAKSWRNIGTALENIANPEPSKLNTRVDSLHPIHQSKFIQDIAGIVSQSDTPAGWLHTRTRFD
jgi:hypothetical protein